MKRRPSLPYIQAFPDRHGKWRYYYRRRGRKRVSLPGRPGNAVISGHRDTHFSFVRELRVGDEIWIERPDGSRRRYLVGETRVVDRSDVRWLAPTEDDRLTLVTCYPFRALRPGGPLRYVVTAIGS